MDTSQMLLHDLDQRIAARVEAIRGEREWWPCQRGCDHCCRHLAHPPELSPAEWERVEGAIAQLPPGEQMIIAERVDALLQQMATQPPTEVVCPYLDEGEGACRIYPFRPLACRTYGFYVARDHDQYCQQIEQEVSDRQEEGIVWGNAETLREEVVRISGKPITFAEHYGKG